MWLMSHQDLGELNLLNIKGSTFRRKARRSNCRVRSTEHSRFSSRLERTGLPVCGGVGRWEGGNDVSVFLLQPFKEGAFSLYILPLKLSQQEFLLSHKETMLPRLWTAFPTWATTLLILTVAGLGDVLGKKKNSHTAEFSSASHPLQQWGMKKSVFYEL